MGAELDHALPLSHSSPKQLNLSVQIMVAAQPQSGADLLPVAYQLQHSPLEGRKSRGRWRERDDDEEGGRAAHTNSLASALHRNMWVTSGIRGRGERAELRVEERKKT